MPAIIRPQNFPFDKRRWPRCDEAAGKFRDSRPTFRSRTGGRIRWDGAGGRSRRGVHSAATGRRAMGTGCMCPAFSILEHSVRRSVPRGWEQANGTRGVRCAAWCKPSQMPRAQVAAGAAIDRSQRGPGVGEIERVSMMNQGVVDRDRPVVRTTHPMGWEARCRNVPPTEEWAPGGDSSEPGQRARDVCGQYFPWTGAGIRFTQD